MFTNATIIKQHLSWDWEMRYIKVIIILGLIIYLSKPLIGIPTITAFNIIKVPTHYSTIQEGINAAFAGDTVLVSHGTYHEHIIINKTITLKGEDEYLMHACMVFRQIFNNHKKVNITPFGNFFPGS